MHTGIKICGMTAEAPVATAIEHGADMIGFIFFDKSPRNVTIETATRLSRFAEKKIEKAAVTVNANDTLLDRIVEAVRPDWLQLHGNEPTERVVSVQKKYGLPVIKVISVRTAEDFETAPAYAQVADRLMFDAKPPPGAELPGGNGIAFDWRLLNSHASEIDYILSGGLDADNVSAALELTGVGFVDVSSGVESGPGVKDVAKIAAFVRTVRDYDTTMAQPDRPKRRDSA